VLFEGGPKVFESGYVAVACWHKFLGNAHIEGFLILARPHIFMEQVIAPSPVWQTLPTPDIDPLNHRVANKLKGIFGHLPSREHLKHIARSMGWGPLSRAEKRVKALLLPRLESLATVILPELETQDGLDRVRAAYASAMRAAPALASRDAAASPPGSPAFVPPPLPLEATISFYLNRKP
jgi:hypothetical protein